MTVENVCYTFDVMVLQILLNMVGVVVVSVIVDPFLLIPIFLLGALFLPIRRIYLKTSKNVKRLEGMGKDSTYW